MCWQNHLPASRRKKFRRDKHPPFFVLFSPATANYRKIPINCIHLRFISKYQLKFTAHQPIRVIN